MILYQNGVMLFFLMGLKSMALQIANPSIFVCEPKKSIVIGLVVYMACENQPYLYLNVALIHIKCKKKKLNLKILFCSQMYSIVCL